MEVYDVLCLHILHFYSVGRGCKESGCAETLWYEKIYEKEGGKGQEIYSI